MAANNQAKGGAMEIRIETRRHQLANGRKPRPRDNGMWAFFFNGATEIEQAWFKSGTYRWAVKQARAHAKEKGFTSIELGG